LLVQFFRPTSDFASTKEQWPYYKYRKGSSLNAGGSIGTSTGDELRSRVKCFEKAGASLSGGFSLNYSDNKSKVTFIDMNGDGLVDKLESDKNGGNIDWNIYFNTGSGYSYPVSYSGTDEWPDFSQTLSGSIYGAISFGFALGFIPIKVVINPKANWGKSLSRTNRQLMDINNDGNPDLVWAGNNGVLNYKMSTIQKSNILIAVHNPGGSKFEMDYNLSESSYDQPSRQYELASVKIYDGYDADDPTGYNEVGRKNWTSN